MNSLFNEGDLIEASKDDSIIRGRLVAAPGQPVLPLTLAISADVAHLTANGYKVKLVERAAPKVELPTDEGWYLDKDETVWDLLGITSDPDHAHHYAPFTRLEPRNITAKAVLDRLASVTLPGDFGPGVYTRLSNLRQEVAEEFGVSS